MSKHDKKLSQNNTTNGDVKSEECASIISEESSSKNNSSSSVDPHPSDVVIMESSSSLILPAISADAFKMEETLNDSVVKPSLVSSENLVPSEALDAEESSSTKFFASSNDSTTAVEMLTETLVTNPTSITVPIGPGETNKTFNQTEKCDTSFISTAEGTSNMGTSGKSIDCDSAVKTVDDELDLKNTKNCSESSDKTSDEREKERQNFKEKKAEFKIIGKKFCADMEIPFPNHKKFDSMIYHLHTTQTLDEKHLKTALEEAAQNKLVSPGTRSTNAIKTDISITSERKTVNNNSEGEGLSTSSNSNIPELTEVNAKYAEYRAICEKYCRSKKLRIPKKKPFLDLMRRLARDRQLDESNLKIALDETGIKLDEKPSRAETKLREKLRAIGLPLFNKETAFAQQTHNQNPVPTYHEQSLERIKDDGGWKFTEDVPPQKKSRTEDGQSEPRTFVDLQRIMDEGDVGMASKYAGGFSKPRNRRKSRSKEVSRISSSNVVLKPNTPVLKENPPFTVPGKTCMVAVVHEDYPKRLVTAQEAVLIRNALLECVGAENSLGPRFHDTYEDCGAVVFECEDQFTVSWVWVYAYAIKPWSDAKLRPTSWEPFEISLEVPTTLKSLTPQALCDKLMSQNPGLSTANWKLKLSNATSSKLVFTIDNISKEKLKLLDLKPFLGFSRIKVDIKPCILT